MSTKPFDKRVPETSEIIKMIRKENKITQKELAKRLNVSQSAVSQYESGQTSLNMKQLQEVLEAMGESLETYFSLCYVISMSKKITHDDLDNSHFKEYYFKCKDAFEPLPKTDNLNTLDKIIIDKAQSLNDLGKQRTIDYMDDLSESQKYKK